MSTDHFLDGVRLASGALARWRAQRCRVVTYARLHDTEPERRKELRRAARLKWGKALDCADRFLSDCLVADRTDDGARLKLLRNVSPPQRFYFYEDESGGLFLARIVWRRGGEIGCRLSDATTLDKERLKRRMRSRYYAL